MPPPPGWGAKQIGWGPPPRQKEYYPTREGPEYYRATGFKPSMKRGTPYPGCTQEDIDELLYATDCSIERFRNVEWKSVSLDYATESLEQRLSSQPGPRMQAARDRLRVALNDPAWGVDLLYKAFYDLDKAFFGGIMRGKVKLRWKGTNEFLLRYMGPEHMNVLGNTLLKIDQPTPVVDICMNAKKIFLTPTPLPKREQVWGTLMHEMVHGK